MIVAVLGKLSVEIRRMSRRKFIGLTFVCFPLASFGKIKVPSKQLTRVKIQKIRVVVTSPAFDFALYKPVQVATLVVFHNKQVKRSWYSHSRERAVGFSLKTVGFSLKWLLFWMCKCLFACLWALSTWNEKSLPWAAHSLMRFSGFRPCGQSHAASK